MTMDSESRSKTTGGQTDASTEKNADFFLREYESYKTKVASIDTYSAISAALSFKLHGIKTLLDIGNGGVFDYETSGIDKIIGLDLFLDSLPKNIVLPINVSMVQGSALDVPININNVDGVVMVMLIHHLVGKTVDDCLSNIKKLFSEAFRVLRPGGKLVIMESCVPSWFFAFEKIVYKPASFIIERSIRHPPTLQYTSKNLVEMMKAAGFIDVVVQNIPKGKHVIHYGVKVPSWVTPVQPVLFSAVRL